MTEERGSKAVECGSCGSMVLKRFSVIKKSKSGLLFCDRKCKQRAQSVDTGLIKPAHYGSGWSNYRAKAFANFGAECKQCGYNKSKKMLDADHIDGDRKNNCLDNLQVLCVWCHAEKTRADWPEA